MATKTKDESKNGAVTTEQAREALQQERQQRERLCLKTINDALRQYDCRLVPIAFIKDGRVVQSVELAANE